MQYIMMAAPLNGTPSTNNPNMYIVLFKENLSKEVGEHFIILLYNLLYRSSGVGYKFSTFWFNLECTCANLTSQPLLRKGTDLRD